MCSSNDLSSKDSPRDKDNGNLLDSISHDDSADTPTVGEQAQVNTNSAEDEEVNDEVYSKLLAEKEEEDNNRIRLND